MLKTFSYSLAYVFYVPVWIQKEQWLLKVGLEPLDHSHSHKAQRVERTHADRALVVLFEATLLDIASGICFCSNYNKTRCLFGYLKLFTF